MRVRLIGTAAGGGVPQWNCNCAVCQEARKPNGRVRPRKQSSVAISADSQRWFLLNASPDICAQIESFRPLGPPADKTRGSAIQAVLLTNADLDHTLGLLLLREGEQLRVHAPAAVRKALCEIAIEATLTGFSGLKWIEPPGTAQPLIGRDGTACGLTCQQIPVRGRAPRFMQREKEPAAAGNVVGYLLADEETGGRLLFLPDVAEIDEGLIGWLPACEALLFDGTFWSENEMQERGVGGGSASSMGHVPISGSGGSLEILSRLPVKTKIYIHINNTNPILLEDSPERGAVVQAGCVVGMDGMDIVI